MLFLGILLLILKSVSILAIDSLTYWIDQSCHDREEFNAAWIKDFIFMARTANTRNKRIENFEPFRLAFETVMNTAHNDPDPFDLDLGQYRGTPSEILDWVSGLVASLTGPVEQDVSNIRFYCDNDPIDKKPNSTARYQLVPDREEDVVKNSKRTLGLDQEIFDQYNYMRRPIHTYGCSQALSNNQLLFAQTLAEPYSPADLKDFVYNYRKPPENLAPLCNDMFTKTVVGDWVDIPDEVPFDQVGMNDNFFTLVASHVLGHEIRHALPMALLDKQKPNSYTWDSVVNMPKAVALNNVNNHLFLDILSQLNQRQWKLSTNREEAKRGVLVKDESIE